MLKNFFLNKRTIRFTICYNSDKCYGSKKKKKSTELEIKRFIARVSLIPAILGKSFHLYSEMASVYSFDRWE